MQKNAYIGSIDEQGFPNIKAMQVRGNNDVKTIYFSTAATTKRVEQYKHNPHACVYFSDNDNYRGVMLVGTVEVTTDKTIREAIWREGDDFYYPKGINDPLYNVLKFSIQFGRVYDTLESHDFIVEK
ncbi:pyridoxamine 5'-phosphate oxidase family protein [Bacteroides sp.]